MSALFLALDIGTSSCRTALFNASGQRIVESTAQEAYPLRTETDGTAELDPHQLLHALQRCLHQTFQFARSTPALAKRPISGVGTSCFWHSLVGINAQGDPLTPIITWADSRCRPDAAQLRKEFVEKEIHKLTGCMLRTSFWPAQLRRLRRLTPELFETVHQWISPAEWIQLALVGKSSCAIGMATGTGLFNPNTLQWEPRLRQACALFRESQLPTISDEPVPVSGPLAREFPELNGTPWFPAIGDGAASNLGSGCTSPQRAAINVGTSAALRIMQEGPHAESPFGLFCYRVDAQRFLIGGAVSNAGNLRAWALRELRTPEPEQLEDLLASRQGPDHGLTVLPFWTAERAPTWNEHICGTLLGLTQATTATDILQALTESTYHRLALIAEQLIAKTGVTPQFLISGGIQHSRSAMQRMADVLNHPVYANPEREASIRGAALYAMEKLNAPIEPLEQTDPILPREPVATRYGADRKKQVALEELLSRHSV
jgi:gluconokinase